MKFDRREVVGLMVSAAAIMVASPATIAAATQSEAIGQSAIDYFDAKGFSAVPPYDLIVDQTFNGGIRYGIVQKEILPRASRAIIPLARVEDLAERHRPGVLAYFHAFAFQTAPGSREGLAIDLVIDFLINQRKLDPKKLLFVSTEKFRPHLDRNPQINANRFFERTMKEAVASGDGSGIFRSPEHPELPAFHTVGLYYPLSGTKADRPSSYPPDGYIEIGEVSIELIGGAKGHEGAALGLERLAMAEGHAIPSFEKSRVALLRAIEKEAARRGIDLPPAYKTFSSG